MHHQNKPANILQASQKIFTHIVVFPVYKKTTALNDRVQWTHYHNAVATIPQKL